jgi:hypothetical protein
MRQWAPELDRPVEDTILRVERHEHIGGQAVSLFEAEEGLAG